MAALSQLGATGTGVVEEWLEEEGAYLQALKKKLLEETQEMEYYTVVLNLCNSE